MLLTVLITAHFCLLIFLFPFSFLFIYFSFFIFFIFIFSSAMSKSFIMEMGDLDSENRKVLSGPPSTLQLSSQLVRELFTVYIICIVEK